jgi:hypothetical protein
LFATLALGNFFSQLLVHGCQLSGPFNDSLLEFLCGPPLFNQAASLLQPNRRFVRCDSQEEHFDRRRKIAPLRASD